MPMKTTESPTILLVDDAESALFLLETQLQEWGYPSLTARSGAEALEILAAAPVDLVVSDQVMPEMDGIELLQKGKELFPDLPFIILTAHGTVPKAVASIRKGADDYLEKFCDPETLRATIERSLQYRKMAREYRELKDYLSEQHGFKSIVTRSKTMARVIDLARKVSRAPSTTVAICGESGTGKEVLAHAIHTASGKMESRFVAVNCAAIPATLLESELFGHVKGAFTGAATDREGKFDLAQQGTILLDEIGDMPLDLQAKLLRVLEERCYSRVGANRLIKADFRIITTTNKNLREMVAQGTFRHDLYHRIGMFPIEIPPLRQRKEDIPLLARHFLDRFRGELGKPLPGISDEAMEVLSEHPWPGNVRELKNTIERAAILSGNDIIRARDLQTALPSPATGEQTVELNLRIPREEFSLDAAVREILEKMLDQCRGNKSKAAKMLGVDRKVFYRRT